MPRSTRIGGRFYLIALFNIGKKFIDIMDDLWTSLRNVLPDHIIRAASPFIFGIVGFITHFGEGLQGAKDLYAAYRNKSIGQRKTRLISGALTCMIAGSGGGLSLSLILSALKVQVTAGTLSAAPILIPGFLAAIYGLALWRKGYIFHRAKEKEAQAKEAFLTCPKDLVSQEARLGKQKEYDLLRNERLTAERMMAFATLEVFSSVLVVTSILLGSTAVIGASVASMGLVPMGLLITGVIAGIFCKVLEHQDEKKEHKYTKKLRKWFVGGKDEVDEEGPAHQKVQSSLDHSPKMLLESKETPEVKMPTAPPSPKLSPKKIIPTLPEEAPKEALKEVEPKLLSDEKAIPQKADETKRPDQTFPMRVEFKGHYRNSLFVPRLKTVLEETAEVDKVAHKIV